MSDRSSPRLVQLQQGTVRRVARVEEPNLRLVSGFESVYSLANAAIASREPLTSLVDRHCSDERLDYDSVYDGSSPWRLLVPIDHPEPARCLVSGTGLTHLGSAIGRDMMHTNGDTSETERVVGGPASEASVPGEGPRIKEALTDSMRMFRAGLEGGRPRQGECGAAPEWFYKGTGSILRACGESLLVPSYAEDGGEEAEIAGVYVIDSGGRPYRVGMTAGNEFSDHKFEKTNYLNLAASKLRNCAIGPELVINPGFGFVSGHVIISRDGNLVWEQAIATGDREMCHSLANIEHHHFKFEGHRRPGDVHVHFFGAHSLSFSDQVQLRSGDLMIVQFDGFGRALRNAVTVAKQPDQLIAVKSLA